jgi:exodeoxyribonuclease V beta subunit
MISNPADDDEYTMRMERDDDAVNIITMHACKGLEFPIVYCPFLVSTQNNRETCIIYHDPDEDNKPVMCLDKDADTKAKSLKEMEDRAEEARLLYVALTRAKSACRIMLKINKYFNKTAFCRVFFGEKVNPGRDSAVEEFGKIAYNSNGRINFDDGTIPIRKQYIADKYPQAGISAREFTGKIKESLSNHSYSSISKQLIRQQDNNENNEKDFFSEYHPKNQITIKKENGIFGFPAGNIAGLCIHEIFEKIDFTVSDKEYVSEKCGEILLKYKFDQSWSDHIADMFFNVVNSAIDDKSGIKLSDIGFDSRLSELEFLFPMENFNSKRFREIFKGQSLYCDKIYEKLIDNYSDAGGMMKGFVDLIFVYGGKYYIADWKSNHLGDQDSDYVYDRLIDEMDKHNYYLQYYIYTAALHRYLRHRMPDYVYEKHIGGVYYFFVRGMNSNSPDKTGIFIDRPKEDVVEKLDKYFAGEY